MGKKQREYCLELPKLKQGEQLFEFNLGDDFWSMFHGGLITNGVVHFQVVVTKFTNHLSALYRASGAVELPCDRCMQPFEAPVSCSQQVIYGYEKNIPQEDADFISISRNQVFLDISQELYDFVCLSLPAKRIPSDCPGKRCPEDVLKRLGINQEEVASETETAIDPRWAALSALKSTLT